MLQQFCRYHFGLKVGAAWTHRVFLFLSLILSSHSLSFSIITISNNFSFMLLGTAFVGFKIDLIQRGVGVGYGKPRHLPKFSSPIILYIENSILAGIIAGSFVDNEVF